MKGKLKMIRLYKNPVITIIFLLTTLLTQAPLLAADSTEDSSLLFGVFPYLSTQKMEHIYAPIAARFSHLVDRPVILRSRPDFERFREQLAQQTYDIVFIQPFDYVRVAASKGYLPLARWVSSSDSDDNGKLRALFVTRADSDLESIQDLEGRAVAVPHRDAAVSLLGKYSLAKNHINAEVRVAGNHLACLQQVQVKRAAACITAQPPVKLFEKKHAVKLKLIYQTDSIPSSLFAIHERVPANQRKSLENELLSWRIGNPAQKNYLSQGAWTRLYPAADSDYDVVREIWSKIGASEQ
jgi:phosphonate transport system substrate-binding protein